MHGTYCGNTQGTCLCSHRLINQATYGEIPDLQHLRVKRQEKRLVHQELYEKAGHHRQGKFPSRIFVHDRQEGLQKIIFQKSCCTEHQGRSHPGSCDENVRAFREGQGERQREIQCPVWIFLGRSQCDARIFENLDQAGWRLRISGGRSTSDDQSEEAIQSRIRMDLLLVGF